MLKCLALIVNVNAMAVVKVIELIGASEEGFDHAMQQVIKRAEKSIRNIRGVKVVSQSVKPRDGKWEYRVDCKVAFLLDA